MPEREPSPTGSEIPLPQVHAQDLDDAGLRDLLRDLAVAGTVLEVKTKGRGAKYASSAKASFEEASQALLQGAVAAIQVRYVFEGTTWCDTLMRNAQGARVVRMKELLPPAGL